MIGAMHSIKTTLFFLVYMLSFIPVTHPFPKLNVYQALLLVLSLHPVVCSWPAEFARLCLPLIFPETLTLSVFPFACCFPLFLHRVFLGDHRARFSPAARRKPTTKTIMACSPVAASSIVPSK